MSMEYCESCDMEIDTDYDCEGIYITTPAVLYGESPEPEYVTFSCGDCQKKMWDEYESRMGAECDHFEAKRRGEL